MHFSRLALIPALLAFCALAYDAICLIAAWRFRAQPAPPANAPLPPVTLLKPLKGCDPEMYECLRSHCTQAYPEFEIIFGVNDASDEALPYLDKLKSEFPNLPITVIVAQEVLGANRKVSNLIQMLRLARHEHVLINDGDIRVPENYLRDVFAEFAHAGDKKVGMVTCLYRGVAGKTLWSKLEAMGINVDFKAAVLAAKFLERDIRFALGSTMATTKEAIASIGGLETIVDYLADDYELGKRISEKGYRVVLSKVIVETFLPNYDHTSFLDHQLRWGRTVRSSRPGGYFGMITTFGMAWALLAVLLNAGYSWAAVWLLATVLLAKVLVTYFVGQRTIGDTEAIRHLWLLPVREIVTPRVWLLSMFGNKIVWRGQVFELREGKLYPEKL
jgi:ceramide glucosyltransferase